jgi:RNA chaperone Hfq
MEMNVHDVFLNRMRRSGETSIVRLIDGTEYEGVLVVFDPMTLVMKVDGCEMLIFKQNVLSIYPSNAAVRVFTESTGRQEA